MAAIRLLISNGQVISLVLVIISLTYYFMGRSSRHFYPIYFLGFFHFLLLIFSEFNLLTINPSFVIGLSILSVFATLLSYFFLTAFVQGELPEVHGPYLIASKVYELKDESRAEIYGPETVAHRKIKYQIWYPATNVDGYKQMKWLKDGVLLPRQLVKTSLLPLPTFILDKAAKIDSHAYYDAPLAGKKESYPVIIISHGWKSFSELHSDLAEDLASHGYIVVTIDHSYGAQAVRFADGSIAYLDKEALPRIASPSEFSKKAHQLTINYGQDLEMVLDELEEHNQQKGFFYQRLDLKRIGHLGHSTGGAGGVYLALKDDRIKAIVGLDSWVNPLDPLKLATGLEIPSLFLRSQQWGLRQNKQALNQLVKESEKACLLELRGVHHIDYPLLYLFSPYMSKIGLTSSYAGEGFSFMQRELVRQFFDGQFKDALFDEQVLKEWIANYDFIHLSDLNKKE